MPLPMLNAIHQLNTAFDISYLPAITLETISSLQIIQLILKAMTHLNFRKMSIIAGVSQNITFFTGTFELGSISNTNHLVTPAWILCTFYLGLHTLSSSYIVYKIIRKKDLLGPFPKISAAMYLMHSRVIFFIIQSFLLRALDSYREKVDSDKQSSYYKSNWLGVTILLAIVNFTLALIPEFLLYHTGNRRCFYAVKTNLYHKTILFNKTLLLLLDFFSDSLGSMPQITATTHLLLSVALTQIIFAKLPFMNFRLLKVATILTAIILSLSLILFLQSLTSNVDFLNGLQVFLLIFPILMVKIALSAMKNLFERILKQTPRSPDHIIHFALLIGEITKDDKEALTADMSFFPSASLLNGILAKNRIDLVSLNEKKLNKGCSNELYTFAIDKLERALSFNPKSPILLLFMAQIYSEKLDNILRAVELIKKLETLTLTIPMRCAITDFRSRIETMYGRHLTNLDKRLELTIHLQSAKVADLLKEDMMQEIEIHLIFWTRLKNETVDVKKAMEEAETIDRLSERVYNRYQRNYDTFEQNFVLPVLLYAAYLSNIRNNAQEGAQVFRRFQARSKEQMMKNKADAEFGNTAILILSVDKKRLGEVIYASGLVRNLFSLGKSTIIGHNFGCLFPSVVGRSLLYFLQDYVSSPNHKLDTPYNIYGKARNGHIFDVEAHFSLYSYLGKEITIMLTLKKTSSNKPLVITNHDGVIVDCSRDVEEMFSKERLYLKSFKSIQSISSGFDLANMAFNTVYSMKGPFKSLSETGNGDNNKEEPNPETFKSVFSETKQLIYRLDTDKKETPEKTTNPKDSIRQPYYNFQTIGNLTQGEDSPFFSPQAKDTTSLNKGSATSHKSSGKINIYTYHNTQTKGEKVLVFQEAEEICRSFTEGKKLLFNRISESSAKRSTPISANVQIKPLLFQGEVYKIVTIDELHRETNSSKNNKSLYQATDKYLSVTNFADEVSETQEIEFSSNIGITRGGESDIKVFFTDKKRLTIATDKHVKQKETRTISNDDLLSSSKDQAIKDSRITKIMKDLIMGKRLQSPFRFLLLAIYLNLIVLAILSAIDFTQATRCLEDISRGVNVINIATLRLSYMIKVWGFALFLYSQSIGLIQFPDKYVQTFIEYMYIDSALLVEWNMQLKESLSYMSEVGFIQEAFANNIKFWGISRDDSQDYIDTNMFIAHDMLISKYIAMSTISDVSQYASIDGIALTLNNTANDFMLSNQRVIQKTEIYLDKTLSSSILMLKVLLILKAFSLALFFIFFGIIVAILTRSYKRLFKALVKIDDSVVDDRISQLNRVKALLEMDIEGKDFVQHASDLLKEYSVEKKLRNQKTWRATFKDRKVILKRLISYLVKISGVALFLLPLFVGVFSNEVVGSITRFKNFKRMSIQIAVFNKACYQADLFSSAFVYQCAFLDDKDMLMYNAQPDVQIQAALDNLKGQPAQLSGLFYDGHEESLDPFIVDILKNKVCIYLEDQYQSECATATKNINNGLLSIIADYVSYTQDYFGQLQAARKSYQPGSNKDVFRYILGMLSYYISPDLTVIKNIFPVITDYIIEKFNGLVEMDRDREYSFSIITYVFLVVYAVFIYFLPIRMLKASDLTRRKILRIVPIEILHESKVMLYYITSDFKTEAGRLKSIV